MVEQHEVVEVIVAVDGEGVLPGVLPVVLLTDYPVQLVVP